MKYNVTIIIEPVGESNNTIVKHIENASFHIAEEQQAVQSVETGECCPSGQHKLDLTLVWKSELQVVELPAHARYLIECLVTQYEKKNLRGYDHLIYQEVAGLLVRVLTIGDREQIKVRIGKARSEYRNTTKSV